MKTIIKNTLILLTITLVAGLALAAVHEVTKEPIVVAQENARDAAYSAVFTDAANFKERAGEISFESKSVTIDEVRDALDASGANIGWVMQVTTKEGYGGDVTLVMGVTSDGTLTGIKVIEMSETPGLGAKCTGSKFTDKFSGIKAGSVTVEEGSADNNKVDAISGATYTTNAVIGAVNAGLSYAYGSLMTGGAGE